MCDDGHTANRAGAGCRRGPFGDNQLMAPGDRLTGLDASFLHLEDGPAHMHVGSTFIFAGPAPGYEAFHEHIASRLHLVPRFRQRLRFVPLRQGRPIWVDDPRFNLRYHVRHTALPTPGSEEQLRTLAARIFSQRLDRSKPVWELWLVAGVAGDRFAVIGKSHHCLVDGVSGMDITTVLFDAQPDPPDLPQPAPWAPEPEPSDTQLMARTVLERVARPAEALRGVRAIFRRPRQIAASALDGLESVGALARAGVAAPSSPFNVAISPYRRLAWVRADLDQFKRVKDEVGATVNDVIVTAVAGALGRFLRARGHATAGVELKAMIPVSVRTADEHGNLGNRVSAFSAPLPVGIEDPRERLATVSAALDDLKDSRQAVGASILTSLADFAPPTILGEVGRVQARQRFFNMVVTNVPGPQFPLYLIGRELLDAFPMVPLAKRQAVCFGIMSYNGRVDFGIVGDHAVMPELDALGEDLEDAIAELEQLVPREPERRRRRRSRRVTSDAG